MLKRIRFLSALVFVFGIANHAPAQEIQPNAAEFWHQRRGPEFNGVSRTAKPPTRWSEDENIQRKKVAIDGAGTSTPIMSGYEGFSALAIPLNEIGDLTGSDKIRWSVDHGTRYVRSPVLCDGLLYFNQSNQTMLTSLDFKIGETVLERTRLDGIRNIFSSLVGADGKVFVTGRGGTTLVIQRGRDLNVLATNHLNERFDASPALAGNQILLRGAKHLYCIAEQ